MTTTPPFLLKQRERSASHAPQQRETTLANYSAGGVTSFVSKLIVRETKNLGLGGPAEELALLLRGLEAAVADLGGGVDELERDLLDRIALGLREQGLAERDRAALGAHDAALDHQPVVLHDAVVRESSHGRDALLREVRRRVGVELRLLLSHAVDLLVDLHTVVVA